MLIASALNESFFGPFQASWRNISSKNGNRWVNSCANTICHYSPPIPGVFDCIRERRTNCKGTIANTRIGFNPMTGCLDFQLGIERLRLRENILRYWRSYTFNMTSPLHCEPHVLTRGDIQSSSIFLLFCTCCVNDRNPMLETL